MFGPWLETRLGEADTGVHGVIIQRSSAKRQPFKTTRASTVLGDFTSTFHVANVVMEFSVAAVQIFMWIYMVSFYIEALRDIRKRRLPYLVTSLAIILLSTAGAILEGLYVYAILFEITPGVDYLNTAVDIEAVYWARFSKPSAILKDSAARIADAVLVFRCGIVWFDRPWVVALPACIFLAGLGIGIRTYIPIDFNDPKLNAADISFTVALNILITLLISFRLVRAHKRLSTALPFTDHKTYLGIVAILIESAAPIAVFGLGYIVAYRCPGLVAWRTTSIFSIFFRASTFIIFRVATGTSWANRTETSAALSRPIEFNGHHQTASDEESSGVEGS
ncbi:hypothetical protein BKA70DRAFT_1411617 [Coprinopsis sp. MPI-PUGE-AT-0042]|nr:hypothetical protein BKA70DRAFT_1411617 [Coprinopsis sp. MPI-PUGE-AT-0042]